MSTRTVPPAGAPADREERLPPELALAFAPVHKRAFGVAVGAASGLVVFAATAVYLLRGGHEPLNLALLAEYFYGYTVSWRGAFVGLLWGGAVGFVAGWFLAFCRNLAFAVSIWVLRTKSELAQTRDFLDHI
jgi:hypothetical protein